MSNVGVMKGEVGGDWEERLDKARVRHRHQPMGERKNNQNLRLDQSQTCVSSALFALAINISPHHYSLALAIHVIQQQLSYLTGCRTAWTCSHKSPPEPLAGGPAGGPAAWDPGLGRPGLELL